MTWKFNTRDTFYFITIAIFFKKKKAPLIKYHISCPWKYYRRTVWLSVKKCFRKDPEQIGQTGQINNHQLVLCERQSSAAGDEDEARLTSSSSTRAAALSICFVFWGSTHNVIWKKDFAGIIKSYLSEFNDF